MTTGWYALPLPSAVYQCVHIQLFLVEDRLCQG